MATASLPSAAIACNKASVACDGSSVASTTAMREQRNRHRISGNDFSCDDSTRHRGPAILGLILFVIAAAVALSVDVPRTAYGIDPKTGEYNADDGKLAQWIDEREKAAA